MVTYRKSKKEARNMMYTVLSLGLALLGGVIRLADGIFLVLVGLAALSWVVTLMRVVREMIW